MPQEKQEQQPRRRARTPKGQFDGSNQLNGAWEPTEIAEVVKEKEVKYEVKTKIDGSSNSTAGKYSKKSKVRPTFGKVTTTFH